ncbi:MAG: glycosyltransferase family 2 protein [Candidatus Saccharibacteria bacterium]|nr:glycosyltransferase family 2 protein [Candidatus Saccharibacteria bacterium]
MKISIIIPVFNAEKYLERCLDSVIQSLNFAKLLNGKKPQAEVILVDNLSTDKSRVICERYVNKYPLALKLIECQKWGASAARNLGVGIAQGEYIWFIDADDAIFEDAVSELVKLADETNSDFVMMSAGVVYPKGGAQENYVLNAVLPTLDDYRSRLVRYGAGPWMFLIRKDWWLKNKLSFREGIIHEDMELISALILYTDNYNAVDKPLYLYYQNPGSVLHKSEWDPHMLDIFPALEGLYTRFKRMKKEKEYHDELEWFFIRNLLIDSAKDFIRFPEGRKGFKGARKILRKYFPNWRRNKFFRKKPLRFRLRCELNYWKRIF